MKYILSIFSVLFVLNLNAQDAGNYNLKMSNISNPEDAKQVTDLIRSIINDTQDPFKNYPHFNDDTDMFEFRSTISLSRSIFEEKFQGIGLQVIEFKKIEKLTPISN